MGLYTHFVKIDFLIRRPPGIYFFPKSGFSFSIDSLQRRESFDGANGMKVGTVYDTSSTARGDAGSFKRVN